MTSSDKSMFRQAALDRLSSPEQLDQLMQVTSPRVWLAAFVLAAAVIATGLWAWFGSVSTEVGGQAVFTRSGGLDSVVVTSSGRVADIAVAAGDDIAQGQLVARLSLPELQDSLNAKRAQKRDLETQRDWLRDTYAKQAKLQRTIADEQRRTLNEQLVILQQRLQTQQELLSEGLIVRRELLTTRSELEDAKGHLLQITASDFEATKKSSMELYGLEQQISELDRSIATVRHQLTLGGTVLSPDAGKVVEVVATSGALLNAGSPILLMERTGRAVKSLEVVVYVPANEGKRMRVGSPILLSPAGVLREEYGYMRGWVTAVSEYPATSAGMMRLLQNEQLVQSLLKSGAVFEIRADLVRDPSTPSGFSWTSSTGPATPIQSGSLGSALITVQRQRPIALVIPALKQWAGL